MNFENSTRLITGHERCIIRKYTQAGTRHTARDIIYKVWETNN